MTSGRGCRSNAKDAWYYCHLLHSIMLWQAMGRSTKIEVDFRSREKNATSVLPLSIFKQIWIVVDNSTKRKDAWCDGHLPHFIRELNRHNSSFAQQKSWYLCTDFLPSSSLTKNPPTTMLRLLLGSENRHHPISSFIKSLVYFQCSRIISGIFRL